MDLVEIYVPMVVFLFGSFIDLNPDALDLHHRGLRYRSSLFQALFRWKFIDLPFVKALEVLFCRYVDKNVDLKINSCYPTFLNTMDAQASDLARLSQRMMCILFQRYLMLQI